MTRRSYWVLWEVTCYHPDHQHGNTKFLIIDDGCDPDFCCGICGVEGNHLPVVTNETETSCMRCRGSGKIVLNYGENKGKPIECPRCEGTGVYKFSHTRKLIGKLYEEDLIELAKKDPTGWR